jgi:hypothetical protein
MNDLDAQAEHAFVVNARVADKGMTEVRFGLVAAA